MSYWPNDIGRTQQGRHEPIIDPNMTEDWEPLTMLDALKFWLGVTGVVLLAVTCIGFITGVLP